MHLDAALANRGGKDRPLVENWSWDRLILPHETKDELRQLQTLIEDPDLAEAYGVDPPSGALLAGPPGTGKTTIARVLAAQAKCSFYSVSAADITSKWVGESEQRIQRLFQRARENAPSVIFIDEIDAVGSDRDFANSYDSRQLTQLLAEMDGITSIKGVFVLAATNRPDVLDPALTRGGRLSRTIWIPQPETEDRRRLLELFSNDMPIVDVDLDELAAITEGMSGADLEALCEQAAAVAMTHGAVDAHHRPMVRHEDFVVALRTLKDSKARVESDATESPLAEHLNRLSGRHRKTVNRPEE
jgi:transitional endoplasmic reticulum ATPase